MITVNDVLTDKTLQVVGEDGDGYSNIMVLNRLCFP